MEKFLSEMKKSADEFRLQRIRLLRTSVMQLWELGPLCAEATMRSVQLGVQSSCDKELSHHDLRLMTSFESYEQRKHAHQKALRPNLRNPSNRTELEALDKAETTRQTEVAKEVEDFDSAFNSTLRTKAGELKAKLVNHMSFLLLYFDSSLLEHDFKQLPGEEPPAPKRSDIKKLTRKKHTGKLEVLGPRGHKKRYPGLELHRVAQGSTEVSPVIETFKSPPYKAAFSVRSEAFEAFAELYETRSRELSEKTKHLVTEGSRWRSRWSEQVELLKK
jgi:hypothetical protein